jgi:hypothetical protein
MNTTAPKLTDAIERTITAYIRAGAYPTVAAEAAGIASETFSHWMALGAKKRGPRRYRAFHAAVRAAAAQARVAAELAVFTNDPRTWLTKGPGRETQETPGWSGVVRPVVALTDNRSVNLLADPGASALLTMLLAALAPYPDARRAAIDALNGVAPAAAGRRVIEQKVPDADAAADPTADAAE